MGQNNQLPKHLRRVQSSGCHIELQGPYPLCGVSVFNNAVGIPWPDNKKNYF